MSTFLDEMNLRSALMSLGTIDHAVEYRGDREQAEADEARLRADDLDTEARHSITFQDFLEELAVLNANEQCAVVNALISGDKLSRWLIEVVTTAAFERAVQTKIKEL